MCELATRKCRVKTDAWAQQPTCLCCKLAPCFVAGIRICCSCTSHPQQAEVMVRYHQAGRDPWFFACRTCGLVHDDKFDACLYCGDVDPLRYEEDVCLSA